MPYTKSRKKVRKSVVRIGKKMLGGILKVEKKVRRSVVRIEEKPYLGACDCLETEKPVYFSVVFVMQS